MRSTSANSSGIRPFGTTTSWLCLMRRDRLERGRQLAPHAPELVALVLVARAQHFGRAGVTARALDAIGVALDELGQAVDFDQQQGGRAGWRQRRVVADTSRPLASESSSTSSSAAGTTRARMSRVTASTACVTLGNVARSVACTGGFGIEPQDDLRDDRERALGADEQMREVVADDVLHDLAAGADDLAGRQHGFEPEHVVLASRRT